MQLSKLLFYLFLGMSIKSTAQTSSIVTDSVLLNLSLTTHEGKIITSKLIIENKGNHKIKNCYSNKDGKVDCVLPTEASYKITIPDSDEMYEYQIPEFTISPLSLSLQFALRPARTLLAGIQVLNNNQVKHITLNTGGEPGRILKITNDTTYAELFFNRQYSVAINGIEIKNNSILTGNSGETLNYVLYFSDSIHAELLPVMKGEALVNIVYTNLSGKPVNNEPVILKSHKTTTEYKIKSNKNGTALVKVPLNDHYIISLTYFPAVFDLSIGNDTNAILTSIVKLQLPSIKEYEITKKETAAKIAKRDSLYKLYGSRKEETIDVLISELDSMVKTGRWKTLPTAASVEADTVVMNVLKRNRGKWHTKVIVADVTGSMYPYMKQVAVWQTIERLNKTKSDYLFFNDGDNKADYEKKIGSTGGIYYSPKNSDSILYKMYLAMHNGSGGDAPENDMEALLQATKYMTDTSALILIADNYAPVKDIELLDKLHVPVKVILCGAAFTDIHPDYLKIAYKTGGSVHTIEEDILNLSMLHEGEIIKIGKAEYQIRGGYFFLVRKI